MVMRRPHRRERGIALLIFLVLLVTGALVYIVDSLSSRTIGSYRAKKTEEALALAREALIGYALRYRDDQVKDGTRDAVYGYLPLPDLGTSRNNNSDPNCHLIPADSSSPALEGCDAARFPGIAYTASGMGPTVVGRLPWRTLGIEPLRDGYGECLWLVVSSSHGRILRTSPPATPPAMNWDTLGQLDIVVANGSTALVSAIASAHDRPVAIVFAPGPVLPGQDRNTSVTDDVAVCGGNYDAANYLDPGLAGALGSVENYFSASPTNHASDPAPVDGAGANKSLSSGGKVQRKTDGTLLPHGCPAGETCNLVANDTGLALTGDALFNALRKSGSFRTDINALLDRMTSCLRDQVAAGTSWTPITMTGTAADKSAGRIPAHSCYDNTQVPLGYFSNYQEEVLVARPSSGNFNVTVDGVPQSCPGVLLMAGPRSGNQSRTTTDEKNLPINYLEGVNFTSFTTGGSSTFSGPSLFARASPTQTAAQDIVRCIPAGASFTTVTSQGLTDAGFGQLVTYDPATRILTLGRENVTTGYGAPGGALYGCAWQPETTPIGNGLRAYFQFRFRELGTSVGSTGFVFAIVDGFNNGSNICGASASHLAYSGDNGVTPRLSFPKIGIEFDQSRNAGFGEWITNPGRRDPCGTSGCGGTVGYNTHAAIVYWGHEQSNTVDGVTRPDNDDNVHGFPSSGSQTGVARPAPKNPDTSPGIEFVDLRGHISEDGDSYLYHVRVELTPARAATGPAETRNTTFKTEVWIERDSGTSTNLIAAMKDTTRAMAQLYPGYSARLRDSAVMYDVAGSSCSVDTDCLTGEACGSDNVCYRRALGTVRLGFTGSQYSQDQQVDISNFFVSWPQ